MLLRAPSLLSLAALGLLLASGPGSRAGLWHFRTGFTLLQWAAYGGILAAVAAAAFALWRRERSRAESWALASALLLGLAVAAGPISFKRAAKKVPPIHDITTDIQDPPPFVAILSLREGSPNPAAYGGPEIARQQAAAYPDLRPATLAMPKEQAFARALEAAKGLGWSVVAAEAAEGRIEATDTTFWFGFRDDVVVRVRPDGAGSRIDIRSVSRVGKSDVGCNARRIRRFLRRL